MLVSMTWGRVKSQSIKDTTSNSCNSLTVYLLQLYLQQISLHFEKNITPVVVTAVQQSWHNNKPFGCETLSSFVAPQWMAARQRCCMLWYTELCFDLLTCPLAGNRVWHSHWQSAWALKRCRTPTVMLKHRENVALVKQHGAVGNHLWTTRTGSGGGERTNGSVWRQARKTNIGSKRIFSFFF